MYVVNRSQTSVETSNREACLNNIKIHFLPYSLRYKDQLVKDVL